MFETIADDGRHSTKNSTCSGSKRYDKSRGKGKQILHAGVGNGKLVDLTVLKRSRDLLNNVKIGQGQIIMNFCFTIDSIMWGCGHFGQVT